MEPQSVRGDSHPIRTKPFATGPVWNLDPCSFTVAEASGKGGEVALEELLGVTPAVAEVE